MRTIVVDETKSSRELSFVIVLDVENRNFAALISTFLPLCSQLVSLTDAETFDFDLLFLKDWPQK